MFEMARTIGTGFRVDRASMSDSSSADLQIQRIRKSAVEDPDVGRNGHDVQWGCGVRRSVVGDPDIGRNDHDVQWGSGIRRSVVGDPDVCLK